MIRGVRKISSSLRVFTVLSVRNSWPRNGMSPTYGTLRSSTASEEVMIPPMTTVCPFGTETNVSVIVTFLIGEVTTLPVATSVKMGTPAKSKLLRSAPTCMKTVPSGLIRGVTCRIRPLLSRSVIGIVELSVTLTPVTTGTSCPT
ncbi:hypothetical protein LzC2_17820 [Planctomycetes bacterium LzC2]|uniref:Secreted protein n=1 Tax=Alienimonas chondri TaxID=2681879 RepID=A0ABX1VCD1_9PLAN|nr:hypothetical protein [Alienimonas chondri]